MAVTLAELVQVLPTEFYDEILDLTLTTDEEVSIDRDYKPPVRLRIDRASRKAVSKTYYADTIFHVRPYLTAEAAREEYLLSWLRSLDSGARRLIKTIYVYKPKRYYRWAADLGLSERYLDHEGHRMGMLKAMPDDMALTKVLHDPFVVIGWTVWLSWEQRHRMRNGA